MDLYLWIKAVHVMAIIAWMAGLFYLPRLYVYHTQTTPGTAESERFKVMEAKLLRIIMNPAMIASWVLGLALVAMNTGWLSQGWLHAKLLLVLLMSGAHGAMSKWRKELAADERRRTEKFFRAMNEVPTVLMFGIVILVVVKPF